MTDNNDMNTDAATNEGSHKINAADLSANFAKVESPSEEGQQGFGHHNPGQQGAAFGEGDHLGDDRNLDTILGIPVNIQVVLGSATMLVSNLLKLGRGAVIPLNHRVGEPIDIVVNGRVIARGEVVVVEDDNSRFGVSLTEIISAQTGTVEA